jgi:coenzyme PQQ precursor peptide PqqA
VAVGADHAIFYVPAVGKGEMLGVLVIPKGRFLGIRIVPSMHGEEWVKPDFEEVSLACEINSYALATL